MSRTAAIQHALDQFESGAFFTTLSRRVGLRTESQESGNEAALRYLTDEIAPKPRVSASRRGSSTIPSTAAARSCSPRATKTTRCRPC